MHAAVHAAHPAQLTIDHAAVGAEIEVSPALDAAVMDLQVRAALPATRADASSAAQPDAHDHTLDTETNIDDRCSGQAKHPVECGLDAHAVLPCRRLSFSTQQPAPRRGGASLAFCATSTEILRKEPLLTPPLRGARHPQDDRRPE